jgi:hypothetical protein
MVISITIPHPEYFKKIESQIRCGKFRNQFFSNSVFDKKARKLGCERKIC